MPTMMQSATQKVRKRSNTLMAGLRADAWPAMAADSLIRRSLTYRKASERGPVPSLAHASQRLAGLDHGGGDALLDAAAGRPGCDGLAALGLHCDFHISETGF